MAVQVSAVFCLEQPQTVGGQNMSLNLVADAGEPNASFLCGRLVWAAAFVLSGEVRRTMARPEKVQAVEQIKERFSASEGALLTEYRGLSVGEMADLRAALREADADYKVLKNTLARIAAKESGLEGLEEMLAGPTAIAFAKKDAAGVAKALDDAAKRFPVLVIKGGILAGKVITAEQAQALAKLEPRETQLAKIAMMMNSPAQQLANVISALLRDLGSMLAQVTDQKQKSEAA